MAPPAVDTLEERQLWLLFAADVVFATGCATQYFAWRLDFHRNLGHRLFEAGPDQRHGLIVLAVALVLGAATTLLSGRWWRAAPACTLLAAGCALAGLTPIYPPYNVVLWTVAYYRNARLIPIVHQSLGMLAACAVASIGATFGVRRGRRPKAVSNSYGTAQWGDSSDLVRKEGLCMGRDARGRVLRYSGDGHLITIAPTRSGKGVGIVIPNLLTYPGPIVVTDPKGENYAVTGARRRTMGVPVHAFDPFDVAGGRAAFNPLDLIKADADEANDECCGIADMLVVSDDRGQEQAFWDREAKAMLAGLVLYVVAHEEGPQRTLARVRALLSATPDQFEGLLKDMTSSSAAHGLVARHANQTLSMETRLLSNVITAARSHVHFLDSPAIAKITGTSTVDLRSIVSERASVYLIVPPERMQTHRAWLRLMIASALRCAMSQRRRPEVRPLFLLDEFANLGRMTPVEDAISLAAGYGITFWLLVQDLGQLRHAYGDSASSFLSNSDVLQAFGVTDFATAEHLSRLAGEQTVIATSESRSSGVTRGRSGSSQEGSGETVSEHARRLVTADEVRRMPSWEQLLFLRSRAPLKVARLDYRVDREFAGLAAPNPLFRSNPQS
jgi:type IV secretion system protein VirD4